VWVKRTHRRPLNARKRGRRMNERLRVTLELVLVGAVLFLAFSLSQVTGHVGELYSRLQVIERATHAPQRSAPTPWRMADAMRPRVPPSAPDK